MGRKPTLKMPALPSEETPHGWKWRKPRPPGARRPPQQIEHAHKLTPLQLLDAHVVFTAVGRPPGPMRPLGGVPEVWCAACSAVYAAWGGLDRLQGPRLLEPQLPH
jgi:hypothetical protein